MKKNTLTCKRCRTEKPKTEFYSEYRQKAGERVIVYRRNCKQCIKVMEAANSLSPARKAANQHQHKTAITRSIEILKIFKANPEMVSMNRRELIKELKCGNDMLSRALYMFNTGASPEEAKKKFCGSAKAIAERGKNTKAEVLGAEYLYRPNNINYLTVAWR